MEFEVINNPLQEVNSHCLVVGIGANAELTPAAQQLDKASDGYISNILAQGDISGKKGESLLLQKVAGINAQRILLLGLGDKAKYSKRTYRQLIEAAMQAVKSLQLTDISFALDGAGSDDEDQYRCIRQLLQTAGQTLYSYDHTKSKKTPAASLQKISVVLTEADTELGEYALLDAAALVNGINTARELGNLPGNICTPSYLAEQAQELAKEHENLKLEVLDEAAMDKLGMHSLLSVGQGSAQPSKLIVMHYQGNSDSQETHALVGKGITFDTGGISLKPGGGMDEMKFDMCGAAAVFGAMTSLCELNLEINVVAIIAAAENMPSSTATKPGDVITTLSGQTVEVLNTDAEGRLVLCDALSYAERFQPSSVVDVATLTGACIVALGHHATGLISNNDELSKALIEASNQTDDKAWRLPLWDEYQEQLDSNFADIANIGTPGAGTITAGCFLSRFTEQYAWAHLDIAGVAWQQGKAKGATGRPVSLLVQYLLNLAASE